MGDVMLPKNITVLVVNESTVATDDQLLKIVGALQRQVSEDFAPVWGIDATLGYVKKGEVPDPAAWVLGIFDTSDQAGALGYHDVTEAGLPLGKVFAKTDLDLGSSLSVTISHELLEMLLDPDINLSVFVQKTDTEGIIYAYEVADACEDDSFGYLIDGVLVSDFVYPAWFESFNLKGPYDKQAKISAPFQLLSGGYISAYQIPNVGGWTQLNGRTQARYQDRAKLGSRRERRRTPQNQWVRSERKK
jgi:hypothetical protein